MSQTKTETLWYLKVWVTSFLLLVYLNDSLACHYCVQVDWGPWDQNCMCGISGYHRLRTQCTACDSPGNYFCPSCVERQYCQPFCKNQGFFNESTDRCECTDRHYGKCCDYSECVSFCLRQVFFYYVYMIQTLYFC